MHRIISEMREKIEELCRLHHVRRLSVFGSAAREEFDASRSNVDLLVDFEPLPYPTSVENYWKLENALAKLFVRKVDMIREGKVRNPYLLRELRAVEETVYAA